MRATAYAFVALAMTLTLSVHAQTVLDFEDGNLDDWLLLDEAPANLGDQGPGTWEIRNSLLSRWSEVPRHVAWDWNKHLPRGRARSCCARRALPWRPPEPRVSPNFWRPT